MMHHNHHTHVLAQALSHIACPIARIEAERKFSPMAMLVARTSQQPAFL